MKTIALFNPSYGTLNMGDFIICESAKKELKPILENNFVISAGTHSPIVTGYQTKTSYSKYFENADLKFLLGTNILKKDMLHRRLDWNFNIFNYHPYKNTILVGAGSDGSFDKVNFYTKKLYCKTLSKDYIHSTRDEKTKRFLEKIGFKAINTGCVTMWDLTPEFCKDIETKKSSTVVFTLTDYRKDKTHDQQLIDILNENYKNIYIWIQGVKDYEYFKSFRNIENIKVIEPTIEAYHKFLSNTKTDYVGTRLHAGIFAMKHKRRTIIISVDNRTDDMKETYNLNTISRNQIITELSKIINSDFETKINIDLERVEKWKNQFN